MTMNLMRYTPQFGLKPFFTDFDRVLDHFFNDAGEPPAAARRTWAPAVDIVEEDKQFVLTADLPDVNRKDIDLRVDDGTLTLRAERKPASDESKDKFRRIERSYGSFVRRFSLPPTIDSDGIDAAYRNGVLRLTLPKTEVRETGRTIAVK